MEKLPQKPDAAIIKTCVHCPGDDVTCPLHAFKQAYQNSQSGNWLALGKKNKLNFAYAEGGKWHLKCQNIVDGIAGGLITIFPLKQRRTIFLRQSTE